MKKIQEALKLTEKAREVMRAIEACGASVELTNAVTLAGDLADALEFMEMKGVAIENGWKVPGDSDPFPTHSWTWYWRGCEMHADDPSVGRPVVHHRSGGGC